MKCGNDTCPLHGPHDRAEVRQRHLPAARASRSGKSGDCISGSGAIKDYFTKEKDENVPLWTSAGARQIVNQEAATPKHRDLDHGGPKRGQTPR